MGGRGSGTVGQRVKDLAKNQFYLQVLGITWSCIDLVVFTKSLDWVFQHYVEVDYFSYSN